MGVPVKTLWPWIPYAQLRRPPEVVSQRGSHRTRSGPPCPEAQTGDLSLCSLPTTRGIAIVCGSIIIYSIWLAAVTIVFKTINIGDLMQVLSGIYEAGRWPVGIYPLWLRGTLTVIFPLAFAITVPAELIAGRVGWWLLAAVGVTAVAFLVCRRLWIWRIRNYSGASA